MPENSPPPLIHTESCLACRLVLDDIVAGEAGAVAFARAEAHLARCEACRAALAQAKAYRRVMRRVGSGARAPSALRERAEALSRQAR